MITVMQRLHQKDVSGRILEMGGWEHLCLPAEFEGVHRSTVLGGYDLRKTEGELLWPDQFGKDELDKLKVFLGEYGAAGQLQQQPAPIGGGLIKTVWFKLWPSEKPIPPLEYVLQSYDTAFTERTTGDPSACSVWGVFHHDNRMNVMLLDCWAERMSYPDLRDKMLSDWNSQYAGDERDPINNAKRPDIVLIEEKGSGQSLIQDLRRAKVHIAAYNPLRADKVSRAHVIAPLLENGLVWLPESKNRKGQPVTWADGFMSQMSRFPNDAHDDYVDTMTQALRLLHDKGFLGLRTTSREDPVDDRQSRRNVQRENPYAV
jgi:predicted phage terminase large subunit-like protein